MKAVPRPDLVLTAVVLGTLPLALPNPYWTDIAIRIGLVGIAAVGLNILMGFAGQLSIGHAALVAGAAYASAILNGRFGLPSAAAILASTAATGLVCLAIARPLLRLRGFALAIGTLGLGLITQMVLVNEVAWTGGPDGMTVDPLALGPFVLVGEARWYWLVAAVLFGALAFSSNLNASPAGRALRALNGSDVAAQVSGVDTGALKIAAFTVAGVFAGISGALTAHYSGFITPDLSAFMRSVEFATMVVLGGRGSTYGALLGAVVITLLPQLLGGAGEYERIAFGLILALTMLFLPQGIVPSLAARLPRVRA